MAFADTAVKNTGRPAGINSSILLDGQVAASYTQFLKTGDTLSRTFYYNMPFKGTHTLQFQAKSTCASESRTAQVNVLGELGSYPIKPIDIYGQTSQPASVQKTSVYFVPESIDVAAFRTNVVAVRILSAKGQYFSLSATGVPATWLQYETPIQAEGEQTTYIYVTPQLPGNYTLSLKAVALDEGLEFKGSVAVYASQPFSGPMNAAAFSKTLEALSESARERPLEVATILIVILVVVLMVGIARLKKTWIFE